MGRERAGWGWVRVVAGEYRGRRLETGPGRAVRPTGDRVREALFSILGPRLPGAAVVDAFAGTGALGIEALSRGAAAVVFVENDPASLDLLRANLERVGSPAEGHVLRADALRPETWPEGLPADLVLADPPYRSGLAEAFLGALARVDALREDGVLLIEHETGIEPADPGWTIRERRRYGDTTLSLFEGAGHGEKGGSHADGNLPRDL